jgi:2-amino-4-hydroxy-6-hydroxymethyldihydropteridine diphosphokinase
MHRTSYAIALGSNRRHGRHGDPRRVLAAAIAAIAVQDIRAERVSRIRTTPALGPAGRSFANAVVIITTPLLPFDLLKRLKSIERVFGRRRGRRWGPRVLDCDIILWSDGCWQESGLVIPHRDFRERSFVLEPLVEVAPTWRDPITGATIRQLLARHCKAHPVDPCSARP